MKKPTFKGVLRGICGFLLFFLMVGFVVSCCMMLFLNILADTMHLTYMPENIAAAAKVTFLNVLLITLLYKLADSIRRKIMVEKPTKIITDATERMMQGDFSVRIPPIHRAGMEGFEPVSYTHLTLPTMAVV